jgi:anti-anti-sigma factor
VHRPTEVSPETAPRTLLVSVDLRAGHVQLSGDLDRSSAHHLLDAVATLGLTDSPTWTVDAAGVTSFGAAGLRALARARAMAAARGRVLVLVGAPPFLTRLLTPGDRDRSPAGPAPRSPVRGQVVRCRTKS